MHISHGFPQLRWKLCEFSKLKERNKSQSINVGYFEGAGCDLGCARFGEISSELTKCWSSGATKF